jgi:uncharacterized damage-inducible protein DinB
MDELSLEFLNFSRTKLLEEYWPRTLQAINDLTDEQIWWRPNEQCNSIGNLLLHLNGNIRQWILGSLGGLSVSRTRDAEFQQRERIDGAALKAALGETLGHVQRVLQHVTQRDLNRQFTIQGHEVSGFTALYHVVEHFAMHHGQILYIVKMLNGRDLGFYAHLTGSETPRV